MPERRAPRVCCLPRPGRTSATAQTAATAARFMRARPQMWTPINWWRYSKGWWVAKYLCLEIRTVMPVGMCSARDLSWEQ